MICLFIWHTVILFLTVFIINILQIFIWLLPCLIIVNRNIPIVFHFRTIILIALQLILQMVSRNSHHLFTKIPCSILKWLYWCARFSNCILYLKLSNFFFSPSCSTSYKVLFLCNFHVLFLYVFQVKKYMMYVVFAFLKM